MKKESTLKWGWVTTLVIITFFVLEILSGYFFKYLPQDFDNGKRIVQVYMGEEPSVPASIESHPYLLYQNTKNYYADGFLQHNSKRYRNKEFEIDKGGVSLRIMALGGSTTYMFPYVKDPDHTWVSQLENLIRKNIDPNVQVINAGQSYATTAELLASYIFRHRYLHPDILIIQTGINDVAPLMFDNYNPEYTHFRSHGQGLSPRRYERTLLRLSRFFRLVYAIWLNKEETVYKAQPLDYKELDRETVLARVQKNDSLGFRRNLEALIRYAQADGVKVILFGDLQAREQYLSRHRPMFEGLEKAKVIGLEKHYRIMEELAGQYNIPFIKPEQDLFDDNWFQDNCHLNEQGEFVQASIVYDFFINHKDEYFENK